MRMLRLLRVMGFRTSIEVPPLGHTKGEPFHEGEPRSTLLKIGADSIISVCREILISIKKLFTASCNALKVSLDWIYIVAARRGSRRG